MNCFWKSKSAMNARNLTPGCACENTVPRVAVVIPFHKPGLSTFEKASLAQAARVLQRYPRIMVVPESLPTDEITAIDSGIRFEQFPARHFASYSAHQQLCRDPQFYFRFLAYEYILFYHLDAYVFRDDLEYWCNQGWDYIGAAFPRYTHITSSKKWYRHALPVFKLLMRQQGQGGFSLRRVRVFYRASMYQRYLIKILSSMNEDLYWACIGSRIHFPFKVADFASSLAFSFEENPEYCYQLNDRRLPFGCHAWDRVGTDFWKQFIRWPLHVSR